MKIPGMIKTQGAGGIYSTPGTPVYLGYSRTAAAPPGSFMYIVLSRQHHVDT